MSATTTMQARHAALPVGIVTVSAVEIAQDGSLGAGNAPMLSSPLLSSTSGKGSAKGRNDVEKLVLEEGPEHMISVWREDVAKKAGGAGRFGGGGDDGAAAGTYGEGHSDLGQPC